MTTMSERYDAFATRYQTWWGPVLAPTALRLLEADPPEPADGEGPHVLDIGTGAGLLAIGAVRRWPTARVVGLDASSGMLGVAAGEADRQLSAADRARLELVTGDAGRLPFAAASFDLVLASFVLQLVADRFAVLREARRVLRPGGRLVTVTWLTDRQDATFAPDEAFEDTLDELDIGGDPDAEEARSGDFRSAASAAAQFRRAGFRAVRAEQVELVHAYDPATYLAFLEEYAEREVFEDLEADQRRLLRERTAARLAELPREAFVWRTPVVEASGQRP